MRICVENLVYKYGMNSALLSRMRGEVDGDNALKGVNITLDKGLTVILGPNGAGKSTLMKILGTFYGYKTGNVFLNELDYKKNITEIRDRIGYLPQHFKAYPSVTGREFLELISGLRKVGNQSQVINEIIEDLEMTDYIDKKIKTYSGGMNQKLGIAQLLVGNPEFMIIDEPTVGLDPEQRGVIREVLSEISSDRIVLVSTHIVEDVENTCDNIIVIRKGEILYQGNKDGLIEKYNGNMYKTRITVKEFKSFKKTCLVVSKKQDGDSYDIVYYSDKESKDEKITPSLEDAYITCQNL